RAPARFVRPYRCAGRRAPVPAPSPPTNRRAGRHHRGEADAGACSRGAEPPRPRTPGPARRTRPPAPPRAADAGDPPTREPGRATTPDVRRSEEGARARVPPPEPEPTDARRVVVSFLPMDSPIRIRDARQHNLK